MRIDLERRRSTCKRLTATLLLAGVLATSVYGVAQNTAWELRACADPHALPFSGRDEAGLENAIGEIIADELGAELTYDWVAFSPDTVNVHLREGTCDVLLGVPEGHMDLTTTITYYRSPYLFVTRADAPFEIDSLDDPDLAELRIGVQNPGVPPHDALLARGYAASIVGPRGDEPNPPDRVLRQVVDGDVDVGVIWGPVGGYFAPTFDTELRLEPVTPLFDPPMLPMSFAMTMGVRPGDDQLRDQLDLAIVARWDEIHAALAEFGVPFIESPAPVASLDIPQAGDGPPAIGVIGPSTTGRRSNRASLYDVVGDAARNGALLAERDGSDLAPGADAVFRHAVTPSAEAAERAVDRLIATEGIDVLVGGLGEGQAERLASAAAEHGALFLNTGSIDLGLRQRRYATTLHVEADAGAYLDVLVDRHAQAGARRWFVVHADDEESALRLEAARDAVARHGCGGEIVGVAAVEALLPTYVDVFGEVGARDADAILLMVGPSDQIAFGGQARQFGVEAQIAALAGPVAQTRDYLAAERERTVARSDVTRVVAWEPSRTRASELSDRYLGRFAQPMEASAYPSYQAVIAALQAIEATDSVRASDLRAWLVDPETNITSPKGPGVAFDEDTRQLRQPLDVIEVVADAKWRNTPDGKLGTARFVASVPDVDRSSDPGASLPTYFGTTGAPVCASHALPQ